MKDQSIDTKLFVFVLHMLTKQRLNVECLYNLVHGTNVDMRSDQNNVALIKYIHFKL